MLVCVVLAGYLYANVRAQRDRYVAPIVVASGYVSYGWPYQYYGALESAPGIKFPATEARKVGLSDTEEGLNGWDRLSLAKDVAVGVYLALLTMQSFECLIRHKEALENAARAGIPPGC